MRRPAGPRFVLAPLGPIPLRLICLLLIPQRPAESLRRDVCWRVTLQVLIRLALTALLEAIPVCRVPAGRLFVVRQQQLLVLEHAEERVPRRGPRQALDCVVRRPRKVDPDTLL